MTMHKEKSELRERAKERATEQRVIDAYTTGRMEVINWLRTNLFSKFARANTPITDHHPISPWDESMRQLAEMETQLYPIPDIAIARAQHIQLPITGDIIVNEITQEQPNKPTTHHIYQDEYDKITRIRQGLVTECQGKMRDFYQKQFAIQHPEQEYFQDPECMPRVIKMALLSKMALEPLETGEFFPGTGIDGIVGVAVKADSTIGDQIICE